MDVDLRFHVNSLRTIPRIVDLSIMVAIWFDIHPYFIKPFHGNYGINKAIVNLPKLEMDGYNLISCIES